MTYFYNSGYHYERNNEGYVISHGQIPSKRGHGYIDVWSAFDGLPPDGQRIPNGTEDHFYTREDAIAACDAHMSGRAAA